MIKNKGSNMNEEESLKITEKDEAASIRSAFWGLIAGGLGIALCYFTWTQPELLGYDL
jgi:hypothetical protein